MASAGFAASRGTSALSQSQTQYLKEAFGVPLGPTTNDLEWPALSTTNVRHELPPGLLKNPAYNTEHRNILQTHSLGRMTPANPLACARSMARGMETLTQRSIINNSQQMFNSNSPQPNGTSSNSAPKNPKLYKTELCRSWMDSGRCNYGERCQYAHGESEKRPIPRHPKYKTEACQSYHQSGYCPYGPRCHFIHNEEPHILAQLVAANAAATAAKPNSNSSSPPLRPANLLTGRTVAAVGSRSGGTAGLGSCGTLNSSQPPSSTSSAISSVAALAAAAFNQQPQLFSRQFQTQLQIFNDGLKNATSNPPTNGQTTGGGSTGESPIPSTDSGSESPACSFSPGSELDDPLLFIRRQLETAKSMPAKTQVDFMSALNAVRQQIPNKQSSIPSTPNELVAPLGSWEVENILLSSTSSSASSTRGPINSPIVGSPSQAISTSSTWSPVVGTPTGAARLPVFERLSNGP